MRPGRYSPPPCFGAAEAGRKPHQVGGCSVAPLPSICTSFGMERQRPGRLFRLSGSLTDSAGKREGSLSEPRPCSPRRSPAKAGGSGWPRNPGPSPLAASPEPRPCLSCVAYWRIREEAAPSLSEPRPYLSRRSRQAKPEAGGSSVGCAPLAASPTDQQTDSSVGRALHADFRPADRLSQSCCVFDPEAQTRREQGRGSRVEGLILIVSILPADQVD